MSDNTFSEWEDTINELDAGPDVSKKEADFIESLLEKRPKYLSSRQIEWLEDMKRKYLL